MERDQTRSTARPRSPPGQCRGRLGTHRCRARPRSCRATSASEPHASHSTRIVVLLSVMVTYPFASRVASPRLAISRRRGIRRATSRQADAPADLDAADLLGRELPQRSGLRQLGQRPRLGLLCCCGIPKAPAGLGLGVTLGPPPVHMAVLMPAAPSDGPMSLPLSTGLTVACLAAALASASIRSASSTPSIISDATAIVSPPFRPVGFSRIDRCSSHSGWTWAGRLARAAVNSSVNSLSASR